MPSTATAPTGCQNDFHLALLWLRSLELINGLEPQMFAGSSPETKEMHDLFSRYHSPYKA